MTDLTVQRGGLTVQGHLYTVNVGTRGRVAILVDDRDDFSIRNAGYGGDGVPITDLILEEDHIVRRADCGGGCMCAMEFV